MSRLPVLKGIELARTYGAAPEPVVTALRHVDLDIYAGEYVAIVGASGSGKSTLLHLLATLDRPTRGRVIVEGIDTSLLSDAGLAGLRAHRIGLVFQQFFLAPERTALENVADGLLYTGAPQDTRERAAARALTRVGLADRLTHKPRELSGGQRQRVAIARALVGSPAILLADEPTGNLDSAAATEVVELLEQLNSEGTTVVVVTHDRDLAARMSRQIRIEDGEVASDTGGVAAPAGVTDEATRVPQPVAALHRREWVPLIAEGARTRPGRALLSALGVALGIAALISVVGLSASSKASVQRDLAALGTNLLRVTPGASLMGETATLPTESLAMVTRIGPVTQAAATGQTGASVYRNELIPRAESGGLTVSAVTLDIAETLALEQAAGSWLDAVGSSTPAVVLGSTAAKQLGVSAATLRAGPVTVVIRDEFAGRRYAVLGILAPAPLARELDTTVLMGWFAAQRYLDFDGTPSALYQRAPDDQVESVRAVLARTASPAAPDEVSVSRPSDALAAAALTDRTLTALLLILGAVSLAVGGVGVANTMVVAALERRQEIGLRRALGATRWHITGQFLGEAVGIAALGGILGAALGLAVVAAVGFVQGWPMVIPLWGVVGALLATLSVGAGAGLLPARRAAKQDPTQALSL